MLQVSGIKDGDRTGVWCVEASPQNLKDASPYLSLSLNREKTDEAGQSALRTLRRYTDQDPAALLSSLKNSFRSGLVRD